MQNVADLELGAAHPGNKRCIRAGLLMFLLSEVLLGCNPAFAVLHWITEGKGSFPAERDSSGMVCF